MPSTLTKTDKRRYAARSSSSSSSSSDRDSEDDAELRAQLAAAAAREKKKNPHAEEGRAKLPRDMAVLQHNNNTQHATRKAKRDLFEDSDNSSDEEEKKDAQETKRNKPAVIRDVIAGSEGEHTGRKKSTKEEKEEEDVGALHINTSYATKYEEVKRKKELQQLTEKYGKRLEKAGAKALLDGEDSNSDDEEDEEDDDAVLLTREHELSFAKALIAVRKAAAAGHTKNTTTSTTATTTTNNADTSTTSDIAKEEEEVPVTKEALLQARFFPPVEEQVERNTAVFQRAMERKRRAALKGQKFTLADEYRRAINTRGDTTSEGLDEAIVNSSAMEGNGEAGSGLRKLRPQSAEERQLRAAFLQSVSASTENFDVVKKNTKEATASIKKAGGQDEDEEEESSRKETLERERRRLLQEAFAIHATDSDNEEEKQDHSKSNAVDEENNNNTKKPKQQRTTSKEDEEEAFIRDFFINELWRPENNTNNDDSAQKVTMAQLAQEEADEAFYRDAELWERDYQEKKYRHEEMNNNSEDVAHVQSFPRPIGEAAAGLLRKPDTARKDARLRKQERLAAARTAQLEELKRLKHLKRQEIEDRRALIASVAGLISHNNNSNNKETTKKNKKNPFSNEDDEDEEAALARLKAVWTDKDLDADYDPQEFSRKMSALFDDEYYKPEKVSEAEMAYFEAELDKEEEGEQSAQANEEDGEDVVLEEPELYKAQSIEEAKRMAALEAEQKKKKTRAHNEEEEEEEDVKAFFPDPFADFSPSSNNVKAKGKASHTSASHNSKEEEEDLVSVLYPSTALQQLEEASFQHRRELDLLQQQHEKLTATLTNSKSSNEEEVQATLAKLKAELREKEEEYYKLHHDAIIADGTIKARFRYRQVPAEDFGLSVEEILTRDDRQLNMIAPLSCYAAYNDRATNERDRQRIMRRLRSGIREVDPTRSSRRYGDVRKTIVLDPQAMSAEEGAQVAERLRKRRREEEGDGDIAEANNKEEEEERKDNASHSQQQQYHKSYGGLHYANPRGGAGGVYRGRGGYNPNYPSNNYYSASRGQGYHNKNTSSSYSSNAQGQDWHKGRGQGGWRPSRGRAAPFHSRGRSRGH